MPFPFSDMQMFILAQSDQAPSGIAQLLGTFGPFILLLVVMYLILIRPQQRRAKEHRQLINQLKAGDHVVTNAGIYGTVKGVQQDTITLTVAENTDLTLSRSSVMRVLNREQGQ